MQRLPGITKGFALSTWNIADDFKHVKTEKQFQTALRSGPGYFVLNTSLTDLFTPVRKHPAFYNLANDGEALGKKKVVMLDEHRENEPVAEAIKKANEAFFRYDVWQTDHPFSTRRASLIKAVLAFLEN